MYNSEVYDLYRLCKGDKFHVEIYLFNYQLRYKLK